MPEDYTNDADVPYRFVPCMIAGLSILFSSKICTRKNSNVKNVI